MKTDAQLKTDVTRELEWDPSVNATNIGVAVKNGVVTLTGHLDTYGEKYAVERIVQRVQGVQALAVELDVKLAPEHKRSDSEIAEAAEVALKWHSEIPNDRIQLRVEKGRITLKGEVDWDFQRRAAERAVQSLIGVVAVNNTIGLKVHATPADIETRIRNALERHALDESKRINVSVSDSKAILTGAVHSWSERMAAQGAAWSAPGIMNVENNIRVA
ncbi:BON domain-containing protein [Variovorax atrisoli]|uniref:BON domain-containing protein n=1 Tax=Variovorax atrisoli TaxID=3394203 RepID=UPI00161F8746|nr:BON domain-containing protein [Variovorax sp. BK613]MBB3642173.1 osmotically-inducible protein OsmY [Variovorax sp. BK613]